MESGVITEIKLLGQKTSGTFENSIDYHYTVKLESGETLPFVTRDRVKMSDAIGSETLYNDGRIVAITYKKVVKENALEVSDFQKAVSALRALGIGVTVQNDVNGKYQIAHIEGDGVSGSIERFDLPSISESIKKSVELNGVDSVSEQIESRSEESRQKSIDAYKEFGDSIKEYKEGE